MKKINLLMAGVLFSTLVFANGPDETKNSSASVAVMNPSGSSLFKVFYKSSKTGDVRVSILNASGKEVLTEKIKRMDGFVRPYNFQGLAEGEYTIQVENEDGKLVEKVNYASGRVERLINVIKMNGDEGKYLLTVATKKASDYTINIYDEAGNLAYNEKRAVNGEFAQVYNLKQLKTFTIEVTDSDGIAKSIKY